MKKKYFVLLILVSLPIVLTCTYFILYNSRAKEGRKNIFEQLLGVYILDINKTKLGVYSKDSIIYKNLSITLNADSTFNMNMKVPFIRDSVGRWRAGNMKEWNWLFFKSFGYNKSMEDMTNPGGTQFTRPYTENSNTYFLINSATPQDNAEVISDIYFKKVNP